jgi:hypothetical protein
MAPNVMFNMDSYKKNGTNCIILMFFSIRIYNNLHYTEQEERRMRDLLLTFIHQKIFGLLYKKGRSRSRRSRIKIFARKRSHIKMMLLRNTDIKCWSTKTIFVCKFYPNIFVQKYLTLHHLNIKHRWIFSQMQSWVTTGNKKVLVQYTTHTQTHTLTHTHTHSHTHTLKLTSSIAVMYVYFFSLF